MTLALRDPGLTRIPYLLVSKTTDGLEKPEARLARQAVAPGGSEEGLVAATSWSCCLTQAKLTLSCF